MIAAACDSHGYANRPLWGRELWARFLSVICCHPERA